MRPLFFEVRCNLSQESPLWNDIHSLSLEVGYPGRGGQMLWKRIGWLNDQLLPAGKGIAHAVWNRASTSLILIFDFLPVMLPDSAVLDKTYRIRKKIKTAAGRSRVSHSGILQGEYRDEHFTLSPQYPE
ncbi:MAG: hypothetical protein KIS77_16520 [Saprospiraceae bacterium]|nr:hypothetical protein [Saprospiraceae bacterium]